MYAGLRLCFSGCGLCGSIRLWGVSHGLHLSPFAWVACVCMRGMRSHVQWYHTCPFAVVFATQALPAQALGACCHGVRWDLLPEAWS